MPEEETKQSYPPLNGHVSIETWRQAAEESQAAADEERLQAYRRWRRRSFWGMVGAAIALAIAWAFVYVVVSTIV